MLIQIQMRKRKARFKIRTLLFLKKSSEKYLIEQNGIKKENLKQKNKERKKEREKVEDATHHVNE